MIWSGRHSWSVAVGAAVGVVLFTMVGCRSTTSVKSGSKRGKPPSSCVADGGSETAGSGGGRGIRIVTDTSGSMKGFALPGSVRLFTLHEIIEKAARDALAGTGSETAIKRCYLGESLDCGMRLPLTALKDATTYSSKESRLDLFLTPPPQPATEPARVAVPPPPAVDPLEDHRLSILVTDGMAVGQGGTNREGPCLAGADPACIGHLLRQRVGQNFGVWIVVLYLPFRGVHFAERPLDDSHWAKLRAHLSGLAKDPRFSGISFQARRVDTQLPFTAFHFEGVKPLLLLAVGRDVQLGRRWLTTFRTFAEGNSIAQPSRAVFAMELAPLDLPARRIEKASLDTTESPRNLRMIVARRKQEYFDILVECQRNGTGRFNLAWTIRPGADQNIPFQWRWEAAGGSLPSQRVSIQPGDEGRDSLAISCGWLRTGDYDSWWTLRPEVNLPLAANHSAFWMELHADNSYEAPERFYGLRDVVGNVLSEAAKRIRVSDCVGITVQYR